MILKRKTTTQPVTFKIKMNNQRATPRYHQKSNNKNVYSNKKYGKCKDKYKYPHKEYKGTNTEDSIIDYKYYTMNGWCRFSKH